jgi:hypothetical protein
MLYFPIRTYFYCGYIVRNYCRMAFELCGRGGFYHIIRFGHIYLCGENHDNGRLHIEAPSHTNVSFSTRPFSMRKLFEPDTVKWLEYIAHRIWQIYEQFQKINVIREEMWGAGIEYDEVHG